MKGKAKIDFEQWFVAKFRSDKKIPKTANPDLINFFYTLHPEFQQGVIRDFFESKGIIITIHYESMMGYYFSIHKDNVLILNDDTDTPFSNGYSNYSTAFTHAIDKACEIYGGEG